MNLYLQITHIWNEYGVFVFTPSLAYENNDDVKGFSIAWGHISIEIFVKSKNTTV